MLGRRSLQRKEFITAGGEAEPAGTYLLKNELSELFPCLERLVVLEEVDPDPVRFCCTVLDDFAFLISSADDDNDAGWL